MVGRIGSIAIRFSQRASGLRENSAKVRDGILVMVVMYEEKEDEEYDRKDG